MDRDALVREMLVAFHDKAEPLLFRSMHAALDVAEKAIRADEREAIASRMQAGQEGRNPRYLDGVDLVIGMLRNQNRSDPGACDELLADAKGSSV